MNDLGGWTGLSFRLFDELVRGDVLDLHVLKQVAGYRLGGDSGAMWMLFPDLGSAGLEVGEPGLEVLEVGFEGGLVIRRGLDQIRLNDLGHLANAIDRVEDVFVEFLLAGFLEARGFDSVNEVCLGTGALDEFGSPVVIAAAVSNGDLGFREGELVLGGGLVVVRVLIGAVDDGVDIDLVSADRLGDRAPDVNRSDDVNLVRTGGRAGSRVRPGVGAACHCQSTGAESGNGQKMSMHV